MSVPKLIALDLDGTLLTDDLRITERTRRAVARLQTVGIDALLCTGRPPRLTRRYAVDLELEDAIVYNGASRYHAPTDQSTHQHQMPASTALAAIERLRSNVPGVLVGLETHHGWYLDAPLFEKRRAKLEAAGHPPPDGVGRAESFVRDAVIKVFATHPQHDAMALERWVSELPVYATWSGPPLLEVMHADVNKREALAAWADERGIAPRDVAVFGDQYNDVEMLAWAGWGVAPANATDEAKAAADEVTASNEEEGVAVVLERWIAARS